MGCRTFLPKRLLGRGAALNFRVSTCLRATHFSIFFRWTQSFSGSELAGVLLSSIVGRLGAMHVCMCYLSPKNDVESSEVFRPGFSPFLHPCRALDRECKAFKPPRVTQEQEEDAKPKKLEQVRGTAQTMVCCRLSSTTTMANNVCLCLGASALAIRESISWHRSHYISVAMSNWQHLTVVWKEV